MQVFTEGVYFLYDGDELVYIGTTDNLYRRIGEHIAQGKKIFDRFEFYPTTDRIRLEGFLIQTLKPKYNVSSGADWFFPRSTDLFPSLSIREAIRKYDDYVGDPTINEIADEIGTYAGALLSGLHKAGAPVYKIKEGFRLDKEWYVEHKDSIWDYVA